MEEEGARINKAGTHEVGQFGGDTSDKLRVCKVLGGKVRGVAA